MTAKSILPDSTGAPVVLVVPRRALALAMCALLGVFAVPSHAGVFLEFADPHPAAGNGFGSSVVALNTGNVVVASPGDDANGTNAGAVYLFNGATGALISTLRGASPGDAIGSGSPAGIVALANGNFVVISPNWSNGAVANAGAVTWGSGTTGVSGVVSVANSLVGSSSGDMTYATAYALPSGNYVVTNASWTNGGAANAGAATWGDGATGTAGAISATNSLVGSTAGDRVGIFLTVLANGNYVVQSLDFTVGGAANAGAATWCSGGTATTGAVSTLNSLCGVSAFDFVGSQVTPLANGHYVVGSPYCAVGGVANAGAATWCDGTTGRIGSVSAANSLVGGTANDHVGTNVCALGNGHYVVGSPNFDLGATTDAGAATWCDGTTGRVGAVSAANSLVGSHAGDNVGAGIVALANGDYVTSTSSWDNGAIADAGAATWCPGGSATIGTVSAANSLVGGTAGDRVGGNGSVTALVNGNYVVVSPYWHNGAAANAGAATWCDGTAGRVGLVSTANSIVGGANDYVALNGVSALANGNYVVLSPAWHNYTGAATWGDGSSGSALGVSSANSLVGSTANQTTATGCHALPNGNYLVFSPGWGSVGAVTWGDGSVGIAGAISAGNSLVGSTANDQVGNPGVAWLASGDFALSSAAWDNGSAVNAGAYTFGSGTAGVTGAVTADNSLMGTTPSTGVTVAVVDSVHSRFVLPFRNGGLDGRGHVFYGPADANPAITNAADVPADQGGWVRLNFARSGVDVADSSTPITMYGVWRLVPGSIANTLGRPASATPPSASARDAWLQGLPLVERDGRLAVTSAGRGEPAVDAAFPAGTWELVVNVPAVQQPAYVVAVPTVSNAAPNDFVVTAHTANPAIWFISGTVSVQSIDNLAPAMPATFAASDSGGQTNLHWAANAEADLNGYRLYRGSTADFTPAPGNLIATTSGTSWTDPGATGYYYKLSAVDVNGNESAFASATAGALGVGPGGVVAFALDPVRPNPARGTSLVVAFALPSGAPAQLRLVDVSGREAAALEVGSLGAGRHVVDLAEGRAVAPGLYWMHLVQGANQATTRLAVIR